MAAALCCRVEAVNANKQAQSIVAHAKDPRFQHLRSLRTPQGRSRTGLYLIEGIRHVARAVEENAPLESIFCAPSALSNTFGQKLARELRRRGVPAVEIASSLYRHLTLAAEPQGLGAVVRQQWTPLDSLHRSDGLWLAVESIDSPGNLGTMLRTAEAAGASGVIVIGTGADPYDPAAIRATMGALFALKLARASLGEFARWAHSSGVAIVGSSPSGLLDYRSVRYRWPAALLVGSEKRGLSPHVSESCDFMVRIPMAGRGDSINAAVASGLLLFELAHQRSAANRVSCATLDRFREEIVEGSDHVRY